MLPKYKYLFTYRLAEVVYDLTAVFCQKFLPGRENLRLREQMVSAARSNKQNIAEGVSEQASLKGQIKLLAVAQASVEELTADYEDFLRQRRLAIWPKTDPRVARFRQIGVAITKSYPPKLPKSLKLLRVKPEEAANLLLTLCHQLSFLLTRQVKATERKFVQSGGYSENLFKKRLNFRRKLR